MNQAVKKVNKKVYRCRGCGAWLDEHELVWLEGGALAHSVHVPSGDYWHEAPCGPIDLGGEHDG
jgi:hypothetical protein